ncbi:MAG: hypothetical protein AAB426_01245 [Myxococcota bacterium]
MKIRRRAPAALCAAAGLLLWTSGAAAQAPAGTEQIDAAGVATEPAPAPAPVHTYTAPAPATVEASMDGGWNTSYGVLFQLNNIFQESDILSSYDRYGFGAQLNLAPTAALRLGVSMYRDSQPQVNTKYTTTQGSDVTTTYNVDNSYASHSFNVGADYLMRMSTSALSPYVGGGLFVDWSRYSQGYKDDLSTPDETTTYKYHTNNLTLGARGLFGIDWRVHKYFSFFAEYSLEVPAFQSYSYYNETTTESTTVGTATEQDKTEQSYSRYFNYNLGLNQGASFGLIALF